MKRSRWNRKTKNWKDNNTHRISKQKSKIRRNLHHHIAHEVSVSREFDTLVVDVPRNFSLIDNTEETMAFFMGFVELLQKEAYDSIRDVATPDETNNEYAFEALNEVYRRVQELTQVPSYQKNNE